MMNHRKIQELIPDYCLGNLEYQQRMIVECHLFNGCWDCLQIAREQHQLNTVILENAEKTEPPPQIKDQILAKITPKEQQQTPQFPPFIGKESGIWQEISPGISSKILYMDADRGTTTMILKVDGGHSLAKHLHHGTEELMVLEGDCYMGERHLKEGDYYRSEPNSLHEETYTKNGCTMFIVAPQIEFLV